MPDVALAKRKLSKRTHLYPFLLSPVVFFLFGTKKRDQIVRDFVKVESAADLDKVGRAIGIIEFSKKENILQVYSFHLMAKLIKTQIFLQFREKPFKKSLGRQLTRLYNDSSHRFLLFLAGFCLNIDVFPTWVLQVVREAIALEAIAIVDIGNTLDFFTIE
jgi:hypothetical protein